MSGASSKQKGAAFEREVCQRLSLWVSNAQHKDLFWRSAMSGGRATVSKGQHRRQAGDISAVAPEGHSLTDRFYVECKFYHKLELDSFFVKGKGSLAGFWVKTVAEAVLYRKSPLLIARQDRWPTLAITAVLGGVRLFDGKAPLASVKHPHFSCDVHHFDEMLALPYLRAGWVKGSE